MGSFWIFVLASFLLAGSLRGHENDLTSGCLWDNMYSLSCTSAGISVLHDVGHESTKLSSWPRSPRLLKTIKHINLSNNMISSLHMAAFYKFLALETLNVSNNYISMVSMNNERGRQDEILTSLHTLVIDRNGLTFVPKGLGKLRSLQTLDLSANHIVRIQRDDFASCTQLQILDLGDNRIHQIDPDAFRDLRKLQVLRLSNNALVSISPLVFLYNHVLRANINLSYNPWACDCRILPLKHLLTSLPVDMKKEWNVTCKSPLPRAGRPLLSIDHINGSCESPMHKYINARNIVVNKREDTYLPCDIKDISGNKKTFWWTPQGVIPGEPSIANHYIDKMNNFILSEHGRFREGLYICIADMERVVYQVHFQADIEKPLIRKPRDVQQLNTRVRTDQELALAVSLSVVVTFVCAFLLGVFLRPCLEKLLRRICKPNSEKNTSDEVYDNEAFSEENISTRNSSNRLGSSLPVHVTKDNSSESDMGYEESNTEYVNVTYNEREIYYNDEQAPTHIELQERSNIYDAVEADSPIPETSHLPNTKRVTWASDEKDSPKINLKHAIALLKPINIVPITEMGSTDDHDQSISVSGTKNEQDYSNVVIPEKNRGSFSETSSDGSEFWDAEDLLSDEDIVINDVSTQQVESANNGSNRLVEDDSSEEDAIINTRANRDHDSPKVNLKHAISLLQPINITVPQFTEYDIVKSPTQKQIFPIPLPRSFKSRNENINNEDIILSRVPENQLKTSLDESQSKASYHSSSSDDGSIDFDYSSDEGVTLKPDLLPTKRASRKTKDDANPTVNLRQLISLLKPIKIIAESSTEEEHIPQYHYQEPKYSFIRPTLESQKTFSDSSSSEDESKENGEDHSLGKGSMFPSLVITKRPWERKETTTPTVNLQHVMSLFKPISITIAEPTVIEQVKRPSEMEFLPTNVSRYPERKSIDDLESEKEPYKKINDSCSSDEGSEFDYNDSSDEDRQLNSGLPPTQIPSWTNNKATSPTVNLQQIISLLKPINIVAQEPVPSTRPTYSMEGKQMSSDSSSSSSDDESVDNHGSDEGTIIPTVVPTKQETWAKPQTASPTVNLKYVMSLIKPINVTFQDSSKTEEVTRPSQTLFFPGSIPRYPDHRMEDDIITIAPVTGGEAKNMLYESSSSDLTDEDSSDDDVKGIPQMPQNHQASFITNIDTRPTVNLQQVISFLKPIKIIAPEYEIRLEERDSLLKPLPEPENWSPNPKYETSFISSRPTNDLESKQMSSNSSSSDDESKKDYSSDEVNIKPPFVLIKHQKVSPTINLQQIISLIKPINIIAPEPVLSTRPAYSMEDKQVSPDSSSSSDNESMEDDNSDDGTISPTVVLTKQETWARPQISSPTVNLKYVMSLIKPINVTFTDSAKIDQVKRPMQFFPGSIPRYPDHRMEDSENLCHYQDIKLSGEPKYKAPNKYGSDSTISTSPLTGGEAKKTLNDSSSDNNTDEDNSDDEVKWIPQVPQQNQATLPGNIDTRPTVNLQQVISLFKPINIIAPENEIRLEERDNLLIPLLEHENWSTNSKYETNDMESKQISTDSSSSDDEANKDYSSNELLTKHQKVSPTVNLQQIISLLKPIKIIAPEPVLFPRPTYTMEGKQMSSDSCSSSDDESVEDNGSGKGPIITSVLTKQETWVKPQTVSPTVNLRHVMSLIKPVIITFPESPKIDLVERPSQTQFFPDSTSRYPQHTIEDITNKPYNENQGYRDSITTNPGLLLTHQPSWKGKGEESHKVDLQKVMSLLKPINILAPDYSVSEPTGSPSQEQFFPASNTSNEAGDDSSSSDSDSKDEDHSSDEGSIKSYDLPITQQSSWIGNESPRVNLQKVMSLLKPINILAPDHSVKDLVGSPSQDELSPAGSTYDVGDVLVSTALPNDNKEMHTFYDSSSSEDEPEKDEDHSSDEGSITSYDLLPTGQIPWTTQEIESPKVNLQKAISLLKPISIVAPGHLRNQTVGSPLEEEFFPAGSTYSEAQDSLSPTGLPNDSSSSGDESKENGDHDSDEGSIGSDLAILDDIRWIPKEDISPTLNLKHVMSLFKPIRFIIPDYKSSETMQSPAQMQFVPSELPRKPEYKAEDTLQRWYDSSSSDDDLKDDHSSVKGNVMPFVPIKNPETWTSKEVTRPSFNLRHAMSLVKPINIVSSESTTDLKMYYPHNHQYMKENEKVENQPQYPNYEQYHVEVITRPIKHKDTLYDGTSSDDGSDREDDNRSHVSDRKDSENVIWTSIENDSTTVNLESMISLVKPINIKAPDSTVTEALRRFKEKYNIQVREHQRGNQLQDTTFEDPYLDKLHSPKTNREDEPKQFVYEMGLDSDPSKGITKLLAWNYDEDSNPNVNLKHTMSLIKPINIIAPDSSSTVTMKSPEQKPKDKLEDTETYQQHHDQYQRFYKDIPTKQIHKTSFKDPNSSSSEIANASYSRSPENEKSRPSYRGDIISSAPFTLKQASPASNDSTSHRLNLKHVISLVKPISIVVPDSTLTDTLEIPTKTLLSDRLSHNTISEYYTDTLHDSSSNDGSFFSFSQSDDPETIDAAKVKEGGLIGKINKDKVSEGHQNITAKSDEGLKDFAEGGYELNKTKDVLHWLNTNTNDEPLLPASKALTTQKPEQELVLDLNKHEWTTRTITRKEPLTVPSYESQTSGNTTYLLPDFGETSTDAGYKEDSSPQWDVIIQKVDSPTVNQSAPKHHGNYHTNKRRVFDAFSDSMKEEPV